ncbi:uncharacterized protein TNCV_3582501 [Trichonephila clavipes]|nr:uncharacterized protein TNCV_3582501 [Trichonephila clavipes]
MGSVRDGWIMHILWHLKTYLRKSTEKLKNVYENGAEITDLSVSFDGTWLTRGHTSLIGVGCVIDMLTGYVVDFEVMSKVCRHCSVAKNKLGQSSAEFSIWYEGHKSECDINHLGSSTSMEMEAALTLWKRSTSLGFRYITVLSDGDSLRSTVKDCRAQGISLGGKAHGSLKEATIKKLTTYYQKAILRNKGDVNAMKTAIYATLLHSISTDAKPQHSKCPAGENSWCFYQSAIANGEKPNNHKLNVGTPINEKFLTKILPIYQRLASNELLERCIRCGTQNANESLHSMIWAKCPKEIFVNKRRVKRAVTEAVCEYNKGGSNSPAREFRATKWSTEIDSCQVIYSQFGLAIHQNDHQARRRFVEWAQNKIAVVPDFHKRILFSDEAHFWLNGYVNKQNCRIWSEANPQVYVETPLHPEKLTVWCALWAGGILLQNR